MHHNREFSPQTQQAITTNSFSRDAHISDPLLRPQAEVLFHNKPTIRYPTSRRLLQLLKESRLSSCYSIGASRCWEAEVIVSYVAAAMAQVLKEVADLGFVIAFRFYGRYPETGRSFYHPPLSENRSVTEAQDAENGRRRRQRLGLVSASSLILPSLSAPSLAEFFASGDFRDIEGVLPSPSALSVGAH